VQKIENVYGPAILAADKEFTKGEPNRRHRAGSHCRLNSIDELFSSTDDLPHNLSCRSPKHKTVAAVFRIVNGTYPSTAQVYLLDFTCDEKSGIYHNECFFFSFVIGPFFLRAMSNDGAVKIGDFTGDLIQRA